MIPKSNQRSPIDCIRDKIYAALETGNAGRAREVLKELEEVDADAAASTRADAVREYGVVL